MEDRSQGTPEEIQDAEGRMMPLEAGLSKSREDLVERWKKAGLTGNLNFNDPSYSPGREALEVKGSINGHKVIFSRLRDLDNGGDGFRGIVDGAVLIGKDAEKAWIKYVEGGFVGETLERQDKKLNEARHEVNQAAEEYASAELLKSIGL